MPDGLSDILSIPAGTSVLVTGPVMTSKRRLMYALLAAGDAASRGTTVVTTRKPAHVVEREFRSFADVSSERLTVVDCLSHGGFGDDEGGPMRRFVSSPGDLTGIGIALTEFMRRYHDEGIAARIGLHSLSTMLMYSDLKRVFQFLHVVTGRIAALEFTGVFVLDEKVVSERDESILLQAFDAVVEVRQRETLEVRVRGADYGPRAWTPVSIDD
ncbi:RAD55 family ATPase [Halogeometricum limi]|uniref:RAD55 family ATPase n=1 Tax=Halogeometricum limi TaxID=555875 RepID=UPI0031846527